MSIMVRPKGKARKIAYALLGKPANLAYKPSKEQQRINARLDADETSLTR